ncbi:hypothetical protein MATL_G00002790 [Megalops atlanticus]|uniref:AIG1-type G domain-containing protein n=1 Tax=Megalops atlanticus TaxID=7932 RepID=A0A9D3QFR5_MEGAT|nr:hypothetical protein MATL_G00002790 [Megalops atlanticus]
MEEEGAGASTDPIRVHIEGGEGADGGGRGSSGLSEVMLSGMVIRACTEGVKKEQSRQSCRRAPRKLEKRKMDTSKQATKTSKRKRRKSMESPPVMNGEVGEGGDGGGRGSSGLSEVTQKSRRCCRGVKSESEKGKMDNSKKAAETRSSKTVLVGKTAAGKNAAGNTILGRKAI